MTKESPISRVWEVIERVSVGMLTTQFSDGLRARPLEARPDRAAGMIRFVVDVRGAKDDEVEAAPDVGLVFVDGSSGVFLSVTGRASIICDASQAAAIWRKTDNVWFAGGPDDPNVRVLCVEPSLAELWDGPGGTLATAFEFAKARLTGNKPNLGENRKVTVPMG
jgi:general stress protein 26